MKIAFFFLSSNDPISPSDDSTMVTLNVVMFSVTYYLKFCNAISIYCAFRILPTNVTLVVWTV